MGRDDTSVTLIEKQEIINPFSSVFMTHKQAAVNYLHMSNVKLKQNGNHIIDQLSNLDYTTAYGTSSQCDAQISAFEVNETVIKMIIKGRSPMMRHVS